MRSSLKYKILFYSSLLLFVFFFLYSSNQKEFREKDNESLSYRIKFDDLLQRYSVLKYHLEKKGLNFPYENDYQYIVSRIVKRDVLNWQSSFRVILKGNHAVKKNTPVLYSGYFVGLVSSIKGDEAEVVTVFSHKQALICDIGSYFAVGILEGGISNELCFLNYLPKEYEFKVGDKVYVSAQSSLAKRRILLGELVEIKDYPLKKTAKVKISWDLRKISYVNLLLD